MKKINELRAGVIISYINLAFGMIVPIIYTPIMLRTLGQAEYGLYSLSNSVIGYLSILSFGLGSTIVRYIAKFRAEKNKLMEEKIIGLFIVVYFVLATIVMICGLFIYNNIALFFGGGLNEVEIAKMRILVLIMSFNTAISFPISVFSSIVTAHEKYIFRKTVDLLSTIGLPVFNIIALYLGYGSVGMALVSTIIQFLMLPINVLFCLKVLNIKPIFSDIPYFMLKEILGFSFYVFLGSIVNMLFWATDKVLLGAMVGSVAVAIYNVGGTFNSIMSNLSMSISNVLVPKITTMIFSDEKKEVWTDLFIKIGRLQYYVIGLIVSGYIVFGKPFIYFIAGEGYGDSYVVGLLTMIPLIIPLIQNVGYNILIAQNKHKFRSIVYLIIAILNAIFTYLSIPYFGIIGAAVCSGISYILGQGIIMNIYYYKVTGLDIQLFWKNILSISNVPFVMILSTFLMSRYINFYTPVNFLVGVIIYTIIYFVTNYFLNMNDYEKDIVRKPILNLIKKFNFKSI